VIFITHNAEAPQKQIEISGTGIQAILVCHTPAIEVDLPYAGSTTEILDLENSGNIPLNFTARRATGSFMFTINGSSNYSGVIPAHSSLGLLVGLIAPSGEEGTFNGAIDITSSDPDNSFVRISVTMNVYNPNHPPVLNLPSEMSVPYNGSKIIKFSGLCI
jgi:hypothetical protein